MKAFKFSAIFIISFIALLLAGCMQMPSEYEMASVEGKVSNKTDFKNFDVLIYEQGKFDEQEELESDFANAYSAAEIYENSYYRISFLKAGTYELVFVGYVENAAEILKVTKNIKVKRNEISNLDLYIPKN